MNITNKDNTSKVVDTCLFNEQRRVIIKETENFYFFAVGNRFEYNYAEKHLCVKLKYR